ncbi:MAG: transcription factor E [Candidatus Hodarchaeota archaeon]
MSRREMLLKQVVIEFAGEDAYEVVTQLKEDEETTDEEIRDGTGMRLNVVRKILYKLYDLHLASYRRTRNKDTGWFVYYWKLEPERIHDLLYEKKVKVLERLRQRFDYETENTFYHCNHDGCPRHTFEEAMANAFKCPICSNKLVHVDNTQIIEMLKKQIAILDEDVKPN